MPTNTFSQTAPEILAPYTRAVEVTPSDTEVLDEVTRGLGAHQPHGAGNPDHSAVKVLMMGDAEPVTIWIQTGNILPVRVSRVYSTGTDAEAVVAFY